MCRAPEGARNPDVFAVVGVAHVACLVEGVMERERGSEGVRGLTLCSETEVVAEQFAVHRVRAVVDYRVGAFHRVLMAEVGDALVGNQHIDGVFAVVGMCHHGNDVGDGSALGDGGAAEDGDVGVAGEVAAAADAVHHLCAEHVG